MQMNDATGYNAIKPQHFLNYLIVRLELLQLTVQIFFHITMYQMVYEWSQHQEKKLHIK